jgi:flagellin-like hook-associated protein FlgL
LATLTELTKLQAKLGAAPNRLHELKTRMQATKQCRGCNVRKSVADA